MKMDAAIVGEDKNYEARADFRCLADAAAIRKDNKRFRAAMKEGPAILKEGKESADEEQSSVDEMESLLEELKGMNAVDDSTDD